MKSFVRKRVYKKKIGDFHGYSVWYVNGYWIRNNLDKDFPNYGVNRTFVFIPKDEIWIDYESGARKEARYYVDMFLAMDKAMEEGKTHEEAIEIANIVEKTEREKSHIVKKLKKIKLRRDVLKRIHKKLLFKKYTDKLKIWLVRGDYVRDLFDVDFYQGGHEKVYSFIPKDEIWIDDDTYKKEIPYVTIHELHERQLMLKGWPYDSLGSQKIFARKEDESGKSAHFSAEDLEFWCREHRKSVKRIILREIAKNEKLNCKQKK
jgi:hypothetical protein